jgi:hypothetical protein
MRNPLVLSAAVLMLHSPAFAQGTKIIDEGSFTIAIGGRTAGRESFRISSVNRGDATEYVATANLTYGDRKVTPELRTATNGAMLDYSVTTKSGATADEWRGGVERGRLAARITSGRGTSAREYIVPAGTIVLDDEIIHHHWFLVQRSRSGNMPVVVPRRADVTSSASLTTVGEESLRVGNHDVQATHVRATISGAVHDIWIDRSGRLLKVSVPERNLVAIRDDPPPA